ncbi:hypothetical protein ABEB36_011619 [Hypothenemus hampei]|uniref:NADH dehydrogenase [ubiquinone] 1 alpha subcomplex assembly factor 2 n=1 Tax=Hypothenemus hampei TaxID=57062 RepID=A0ABD1E9C0_HYPHA
MANPPARSIWKMILTNFFNSLKPRQFRGNYMGSDPYGNKYFEIPVNASSARSKPARWFEPPVKEDFQSELSPEWESWLRGRRKDIPSDEEVAKNLQIMQLKKRNALEIDLKGGLPAPVEKGFESYPARSDLERIPGEKLKKKT